MDGFILGLIVGVVFSISLFLLFKFIDFIQQRSENAKVNEWKEVSQKLKEKSKLLSKIKTISKGYQEGRLSREEYKELIKKYNQQLADIELEIDKLIQDLAEKKYKELYDEEMEKFDKNVDYLVQLNKKLNEFKQKLTFYSEENAKLKKELNKKEKELDALKIEVEELRKSSSEIIKPYQNKIDILNEKIQDLEQKIKEYKEEIEKLLKKNEELENENISLKEKLKEYGNLDVIVESKENEYKQQIEQLKQEIENYKKMIEEMKNEQQPNVQQYFEEIEKLKKENEELKQKLSSLSSNDNEDLVLSKIKEKYENLLKEKDQEIRKLEEKIVELSKKKENVSESEEQQQLKQEIAKLEEKLKEKDELIRNFEIEISKYKKIVSDLMEQVEKSKNIESILRENQELKKKITNLLSLIEKIEKNKQIEIEKLNSKIKYLEEQLSKQTPTEQQNLDVRNEVHEPSTEKKISEDDISSATQQEEIVDNGVSGIIADKIKSVFSNYNPVFDYFNAIKKLLNITKNINITDKKHHTLEEVVDNFEGTKYEVCVLFKNVAEKLGKNKIAIIKYLDSSGRENYICGIKVGDSYILCDPFSGELNLKKYKDLNSLSFVKKVLEVKE